MNFRISRHLLYCCVANLKFKPPSRSTHFNVVDCISSTKRCLSSSAARRWFGEETNEIESTSSGADDIFSVPAAENDTSMSNTDHLDEELDDFADTENVLVDITDYEAIAGNDPYKMKAMKSVLQDIQTLRERGFLFIPNRISPKKWMTLLKCRTYVDRKYFLKSLWITEKRDAAKRRIKQERKKISVKPETQDKKLTTSSVLEYRLGHNTLFHRKYNGLIKSYYNYRLAMAEWFGPHLIIDCGYEKYMGMKELHHCSRQLIHSWCFNRPKPNPFNIIFCNVKEGDEVHKKFCELLPHAGTAESPVNFTNKHYTDLFPAKKLIYLSPHSEHEMENYEGDCVYVIGAFVDEIVHDPVSMERAKRDGIRTARFPIDKYLNWCQGSKFLPMNHCVEILSRLQTGLPWEEALRCISRRKLNYIGMDFKKDPKIDLLSSSHMWDIYEYEMGQKPSKKMLINRPKDQKKVENENSTNVRLESEI